MPRQTKQIHYHPLSVHRWSESDLRGCRVGCWRSLSLWRRGCSSQALRYPYLLYSKKPITSVSLMCVRTCAGGSITNPSPLLSYLPQNSWIAMFITTSVCLTFLKDAVLCQTGHYLAPRFGLPGWVLGGEGGGKKGDQSWVLSGWAEMALVWVKFGDDWVLQHVSRLRPSSRRADLNLSKCDERRA